MQITMYLIPVVNGRVIHPLVLSTEIVHPEVVYHAYQTCYV